MAAALEQFGTIGLDRAVAPAIRLAEEGFALSWFETMWQAQDLALLNRFPTTAATFLNDGYPHRLPFLSEPGAAGMLRQPELGATLRAIADQGPSVLYGGPVGERIARHVRENGGILSVEDLAGYTATVHAQSTLGTYRGANVIGMKGGTGAPTVMEILNILENFDVRASGHNSAEYLHAFIESSGQAICRSLRLHGRSHPCARTPGWSPCQRVRRGDGAEDRCRAGASGTDRGRPVAVSSRQQRGRHETAARVIRRIHDTSRRHG